MPISLDNKLDLAELIEKYGSNAFQDFEGFSSSEEHELLIKEIIKCSKLFEYREDPEYTQTLCDIVLIKILGEFNEGDFEISYYVEKILDTMIFWDDVLSCRYLLKSGIDWLKKLVN